MEKSLRVARLSNGVTFLPVPAKNSSSFLYPGGAFLLTDLVPLMESWSIARDKSPGGELRSRKGSARSAR